MQGSKVLTPSPPLTSSSSHQAPDCYWSADRGLRSPGLIYKQCLNGVWPTVRTTLLLLLSSPLRVLLPPPPGAPSSKPGALSSPSCHSIARLLGKSFHPTSGESGLNPRTLSVEPRTHWAVLPLHKLLRALVHPHTHTPPFLQVRHSTLLTSDVTRAVSPPAVACPAHSTQLSFISNSSLI